MAFYKLCDCGHRNVFAQRVLAPRSCEVCGRSLLGRVAIDEADQSDQTEISSSDPQPSAPASSGVYFTLDAVDYSGSIRLPLGGGVVGRAGLGASLLADSGDVSRRHLEVHYWGQIGLTIKDISSFGTSVNGELLEKSMPKFVRDGDVIKLHSFELKVTRHSEE